MKSVNTVIADIKAKVYDGNAYEPVVKVTATVDGKKTTLTEGADYRVLYEKNTNAGEGKVTIKGNGIYKGQIDKTFTISQKPVKKLKIFTGGVVGTPDASTALPVYVYDGAVRLTSFVTRCPAFQILPIFTLQNTHIMCNIKNRKIWEGEPHD